MISATALLLVSTLLAASTVDVKSTSECPARADVEVRLGPLLPSTRETDEDRHVAEIEVSEARADQSAMLHLRLLRADGHVVGDRSLPLQGTCQETADAVAAIIAAWETTPLPPAATSEHPDPTVVVAATPPATLPPAPLQLFAGAAAGLALVGGIAANGGVELLLGRSASRWQLRLGAARQTTRQLDMSPGHVDWLHTSFAAGLAFRLRHPVWLLALDAGPMLGFATLTGSGFANPREQSSFEWGGNGGLRAGRWFGRFGVWAEGRASVWVKGEQAYVAGTRAKGDLPLWDVTASLGLSVLVF